MSAAVGRLQRAMNEWIDWIIVGALLAGSVFFLFPKVRYAWAYLIVGALVLLRGRLKRAFFERTSLDAPIGVLVFLAMVTGFTSSEVSSSFGKIAGVLFGVLLYYAALAVMKTEEFIRLGIYALILGAVTFALVGVVDSDLYPELWFSRDLLAVLHVPTYRWGLPGAENGVSPNALAGGLLLATPLSLFAFVAGGRPLNARAGGWNLEGVVLFASSAVLVAVIFLSQSYAAWVALPLVVWLFGLKLRWKAISLAAMLLMIATIYAAPSLRESLTPTRASGSIQTKFENRYPFWQKGIRTVLKSPVVGVGLNRLHDEPGIGYANAHAHNQFITTGAELGVAGLVAYVATLIGAAWISWDVARRARVSWMRTAARGLAAGQAAFLIFGIGDAIPLGAKLGVLFWISLALLAAMHAFTAREGLLSSGPATGVVDLA